MSADMFSPVEILVTAQATMDSYHPARQANDNDPPSAPDANEFVGETHNHPPLAIKVVSGFLSISVFSGALVAFGANTSAAGAWFRYAALLSGILAGASAVGFWQLKRWGVYAAAGLIALPLIVLLKFGVGDPRSWISLVAGLASGPGIALTVGYRHWPQMR